MADAVFQVDHVLAGLQRGALLDQAAAAVAHPGRAAVALEELVVGEAGQPRLRPDETRATARPPRGRRGRRRVRRCRPAVRPGGRPGPGCRTAAAPCSPALSRRRRSVAQARHVAARAVPGPWSRKPACRPGSRSSQRPAASPAIQAPASEDVAQARAGPVARAGSTSSSTAGSTGSVSSRPSRRRGSSPSSRSDCSCSRTGSSQKTGVPSGR